MKSQGLRLTKATATKVGATGLGKTELRPACVCDFVNASSSTDVGYFSTVLLSLANVGMSVCMCLSHIVTMTVTKAFLAEGEK